MGLWNKNEKKAGLVWLNSKTFFDIWKEWDESSLESWQSYKTEES